LKYHADAAPIRRDAHHGLRSDINLAAVGSIETRDHHQGRGLARSARAQQRDELPGIDREIEIIDGDHRAKALGQMFDRHRRTRRALCRLTVCVFGSPRIESGCHAITLGYLEPHGKPKFARSD
jgi:hypothetical protein